MQGNNLAYWRAWISLAVSYTHLDVYKRQDVDRCWAELGAALTEDYETTEKFLLEDCTADEFAWVLSLIHIYCNRDGRGARCSTTMRSSRTGRS